MAATHSPWTPAEVADALAAAAKHTAMRGEKLVVHWKDVADELSAKGGFRTASAIQHHFAGVDIPGGLAAGPHARYGDDENHVLLDLMNTPAFMYTRGTRVCHKWDEIQAALAARGYVRTVNAVKAHASSLQEA